MNTLFIFFYIKALRAQTRKEFLVNGNIPDWFTKLQQPEIKALWSDESDQESDSDHDSSTSGFHLFDVNMFSSDFENLVRLLMIQCLLKEMGLLSIRAGLVLLCQCCHLKCHPYDPAL